MLCRIKMFLFHCDVIKLSTRKPRRVRNKTTKFRQKNILNDRIIFNLGDKLQDRGGSKGANQDLAPHQTVAVGAPTTQSSLTLRIHDNL